MSIDKEHRFNQFLTYNNIFFDEVKNEFLLKKDESSHHPQIIKNFQLFDINRQKNESSNHSKQLENDNDQPYIRFTDPLNYKNFPKYNIKDMFYCENRGNLISCYKNFTFVWSCSKLIILKNGIDWKYIDTFIPHNYPNSNYDGDEIYISEGESSSYDSDFDVRVASTPIQAIENGTIQLIIPESIVQFVPHTVHSIKIGKFKGKDVLSVCVTDGRAVLYDLSNFNEENPKLEVVFSLKTNRLSRCCFDSIGDYIVTGGFYNLVVAYVKDSEHIYYFTTNDVIGEIYTDVQITSATQNEVWVTATTSLGDIKSFVFENKKSQDQITEVLNYQTSPFVKLNVTNPCQLKNHILKLKQTKSNIKLAESALTINAVNLQNFKKIQDTNEFGLFSDVDTTKILNNGKILDIPHNLVIKTINEPSKFTTTKIHSASFQMKDNGLPKYFEGIITTNEKVKQIKKYYLNQQIETPNIPKILDSKLLIITTQNRIGLFTADSLLCIAESSNVFPVLPDRLNTANKLSFVKIIPQLSAIIVVSQIGFLSIFRLVVNDGIYSLRQEYIYPLENWQQRINSEIIGIDFTKVQNDNGQTSYLIYLMDIDSAFTKFELKENENDFLDMEFI